MFGYIFIKIVYRSHFMQRTKCGALAHKFITGFEVIYNILSTMNLFLTFDIHNTYIV